MQHELVERRGWIGQRAFSAGLNFAMLLPGPEAQQLATYIGWRLHGLRGALAAGILFVAPGALLLGALAWLATAYGETMWVAALFDGFRPVVVAIIAAALWRLSKRSLQSGAAWMLALGAFAALVVFHAAFPLVIVAALLIGAASARRFPGLFAHAHGVPGAADEPAGHAGPAPSAGRIVRLVVVFAALWAAPVFFVIGTFGADPWQGIAQLFTKAAFVTFGGAYAVLPYVAGEAVEHYRWLAAGDMINGLALAETTPGPLILVTQWIGWFAGWNQPGALTPLAAGILGAGLTTYVERIARNAYAGAALGAVTAAVVGVIASLGVYIGRASIFPHWAEGDWTPDRLAIGLAGAALIALTHTKISIPWIVLAGGAAGILARLAGLTG
jgi:chromate transporter